MNFSAKNRTGLLEKLSEETLDLLIIGGGITGAGIALDAVLRGWKVGLVEKNDFASGTSSRSTKLIHGGLRYLKQFELKLVHETGTERAVIHKNAPHLVRPEDMLLPIIEGGTLGKIGTGLALWVYDKLAGVKSDEAFDMLSEKETIEAEPLLKKEGLKGGALYTEYRTDDARLTIETLKTAVSKGAICVNYTEATELIYENKKLKSVNVTDSLTGKSYTINAQVVVNAAGPWVDSLREKDHSINEKKLSEQLKLTVFRIIQEQLTNISKHADAKNVSISLKMNKAGLSVIIKDDGKGFDIDEKIKGVGLKNILSRAQLHNGKAVILAEKGKGCKLSVLFKI